MVEPKKNVMLIHGVLMNPIEMRYLGNQLEKSGFKAKITIEEGIKELINVFSNNKEKNINNY